MIQGYGTFDSYEGCRGLYPATSRLQSVIRIINISYFKFLFNIIIIVLMYRCLHGSTTSSTEIPATFWRLTWPLAGTGHGAWSVFQTLKDNHGLFSFLLRFSWSVFQSFKRHSWYNIFKIRQTRLAEERAWPQPMYGDLVTNIVVCIWSFEAQQLHGDIVTLIMKKKASLLEVCRWCNASKMVETNILITINDVSAFLQRWLDAQPLQVITRWLYQVMSWLYKRKCVPIFQERTKVYISFAKYAWQDFKIEHDPRLHWELLSFS